MKTKFEIEVELSDDPIKSGDAFYFEQDGGIPTIRIAQDHEDWNGIYQSNTGEKKYRRIEKINGVLFSPKIIFKNLTS